MKECFVRHVLISSTDHTIVFTVSYDIVTSFMSIFSARIEKNTKAYDHISPIL